MSFSQSLAPTLHTLRQTASKQQFKPSSRTVFNLSSSFTRAISTGRSHNYASAAPHPHNPTSSATSPPPPASQSQSQPEPNPIESHPIYHSLTNNPQYTLSRPHLTIPSHLKPAHLVAGPLSGAQKIAHAPYTFTRTSKSTSNGPQAQVTKSSTTTLFTIGPLLCGHPGFVHGGLMSVMFDEAFARCVSTSFKSGLGMTANLNVDFRAPGVPGRVFVLRAETVKVEGRKAFVEGQLRACGRKEGEEQLVAEARALFVEPKFAENLVPLYRS